MIAFHTAAALAIAAPALAGDPYPYPFWIERDGVWTDASGWSTGAVPGEGSAILNNGATLTLDVDVELFSFAVGYNGIDTSLSPYAQHADFVHPAGRHLGVSLALGIGGRDLPGGPSTYTMAGAGTLQARSVQVGLRGNGELILGDGAAADLGYLTLAPVQQISNEGLGKGRLVVEGPGTTLMAERLLSGDRGHAEVVIRGGASVAVAYTGFSASTTEPAFVTVTGAGTELVVLDDPSVFFEGVGVGATPYPVIPEDEIAPVIMTIDDGAVVRAAEGNDDASFRMGHPSILRGDGTIDMPGFGLYAGGRIEPGTPDAPGTLTLDAACEFVGSNANPGRPATLAIKIMPEGHDRVIVGDLQLGLFEKTPVLLEAELINLPAPALGTRYEVVTITGAFDAHQFFTRLSVPDVGTGKILRPVYSADRIELVVACLADLNVDEAVNADDVGAFADAFVRDNPVADLNLDGVINFDDIEAFVEAYLNIDC